MNRDVYIPILRSLILSLIYDKQYEEALDAENRCLEINAQEIFCLAHKAYTLVFLRRFSEAALIVNQALPLSAVTEVDTYAKQDLRKLKLILDARASREGPNQIGGR
jgi:hypothetical protein